VVQSDLYPDGEIVDLAEADAVTQIGDDAFAYARPGPDRQVARLDITTNAAPKAPPLWFAELDAYDASPASTTLVAFTGHDVEPGTFVNRAQLRDTGVASADQLGAFKWYPGSGFSDQLYVSPDWRRRTIGTGLLVAAGALTLARGWASLWTDGQRTADGDRMRAASRWSHLAADLTHLMPPMTPVEKRDT
jgi:GNAT superfamily N-acetyltransferase